MKRFLQAIRESRLLLSGTLVLLVLMVYALFGFLLLPWAIKHYAPGIAADQIKRDLSIGELGFNPFLFKLEIKDFALKEKNGDPVVTFKRLFVDFEPTSLFQKAWTFADIQLDQPAVSVAIDKQAKLNFVKIAEDLPKSAEPAPPPPEDTEPAKLLFKHLQITEGSVRYADFSKNPAIKEDITPFSLSLDDLTTLPNSEGKHVVKATLGQGGELEWKGNLSVNPIASSGDVSLKGMKLALPWRFVRGQFNLAEPGGDVSVGAHYDFHLVKDSTEFAAKGISVTLRGLNLALEGVKNPLLALDQIELSDGRFDLASQSLTIPKFTIRKGKVMAAMDERGALDWQNVAKPGKKETPPPAKSTAPVTQKPWKIQLESFELGELGVSFSDASRSTPLVAAIGALGIKFNVDVEAGSGAPKVLLDKLNVDLQRIFLNADGHEKPLFSLDGIALSGGKLNLEQQTVSIAEIALRGGSTAISRDTEGAIFPLTVFMGKNAPEAEAQAEAPHEAGKPAQPQQEGKPWRFDVQKVGMEGFQVALADRSAAPEIVYDLQNIAIGLQHITNDGKTPYAFDAGLTVKQGGSLKVAGTLTQAIDKADAKIQVDRFDLKPLQAMLAQVGALKLESGNVSTQMQVNYQSVKSTPAIKATGTAAVAGLMLKEAKSGKRFLSWKGLSVSGIDFALAPDKLNIKEINIVEPGANIEIFEDESSNISAIFATPKAAKPKEAPKPAKPVAKTAEKPFQLAIQRVSVNKGLIDFSHQALILPFATQIHQFDGAASGISTDPKAKTQLKFNGHVDRYGEVTVGGELRPMQHKAYSDVKVSFKNVDMSSLSPFSGTFAGRKIQSGKLNVDLEYKTNEGKLKSENTILLDQLTLGEEIVSPKATSLPLDLAIALLTDSEGKIDVSIPVEGNVDDPQFAIGKVIWGAFVNLITKVVTAPFNALGSLFGGGEDIGEIRFDEGKAVLPPPEQEKLKKVAAALGKRPKVAVEVHGGYDAKLDATAIKSRQIRQQLAKELDFKVVEGEDPGPVALENADAQKALETLSNERGKAFGDEIQASFEKAAGKKVKRLTGISSLVSGASEDHGFYQALFDKLVETSPLTPQALEDLASKRAQAIASELVKLPGLSPERVKTGKSEAVEGKEGRVASRLDLEAGK